MPVDVNKLVTIDNDLRTINIPSGISILGVQYDDDVHKICFEMPRHVSDTDLSDFSIRVNYKNSNGDGDVFEVEDKVVNENNITFSWVVGPTAFLSVGDVLFSICLKKYADDGIVDKEYNTTIAKLPVLEGLETSPLVVRENAYVLERWKLELFDIVKDSGKTAYEYAVEGGYEGSEEEKIRVWCWNTNCTPLNKEELEIWFNILKEELKIDDEERAAALYDKIYYDEDLSVEKEKYKNALFKMKEESEERGYPVHMNCWRINEEGLEKAKETDPLAVELIRQFSIQCIEDKALLMKIDGKDVVVKYKD